MNLADIRKKARQEKARELPDSKTTSSSAPAADHAAGVAEQDSIAVCKEEPFPATTPEEKAEPVLAEELPEELPAVFDPVSEILAGRQSAETASAAVEAFHQESTENVEDSLKYLRFRVANEEYGVGLLEIREIIKPRDITEVPSMPDFVAGVVSLRGIIIPVFNLRLRLGLGTNKAPGRERIIIARRQEGLFGLFVDEVYQVINLSASSIENPPPVLEGIDREFVSGIGRHGQQMLILLALEKILDISLR
jgi:purine-binding chemotaxis protein CheW